MEAILLLTLDERNNPFQMFDDKFRCRLLQLIEVGQWLRTDRFEFHRSPDSRPRSRCRTGRRQETQFAGMQRSVLDAQVGVNGRQTLNGQLDENAPQTAVSRFDDALAHLSREDLGIDDRSQSENLNSQRQKSKHW